VLKYHNTTFHDQTYRKDTHPSSAEVKKMSEAYTSVPPIRLRGVVLSYKAQR